MAAIKQFLEEVDWGVLDYLIIDLPPGTGDEPLSIVQLIGKVDGSVVVTTPQDVALTSVRKSLKFADMLNVPVIGLVENMSGVICPDCGKEIDIFGRGSIEKAAEDFNIKILAALPIEPEISATGDAGKVYVEEMDSKWSKGFDDIVDAVEKFTKKK